MNAQSKLQYLIEFGRTGPPWVQHVIVYAAGSPKAKRRTLCGIPRSEVKASAPFDAGTEKMRDLWFALEPECSARMDAMHNV